MSSKNPARSKPVLAVLVDRTNRKELVPVDPEYFATMSTLYAYPSTGPEDKRAASQSPDNRSLSALLSRPVILGNLPSPVPDEPVIFAERASDTKPGEAPSWQLYTRKGPGGKTPPKKGGGTDRFAQDTTRRIVED